MSEQEQQKEPGIVSVNDRGATSDGLWKKLIFFVVILGMLAVGAVVALNRWRAYIAQREAARPSAAKDAGAASAVGLQKTFAPLPAQAPASTPSSEAGGGRSASAPAAAKCAPIEVRDAAGRPILGSDGLPIRIDCNGRVVPGINGASPVGGQLQGGTAEATARPPSPYDGDVLLQPPERAAKPGAAGRSSVETAGAATTAALLRTVLGQGAGAPAGGVINVPSENVPSAAGAAGGGAAPSAQGRVGALLAHTPTPRVKATLLGSEDFLLAKGTQFPCALTLRLTSDVSGFAQCVLTNNVYSANGKVLLLERGSVAHGEYTASMRQGQQRLPVLWDDIRTPNGVDIALASPATNSLGTMGLGGYVDNHWGARLGAAFMLSMVQDAVGYEVAKASSSGNGTTGGVVFQNTAQTGDQMAGKVLDSTINIKPTIYKNQGDLANVYVARDLDFSSVYGLRIR